MSCRARILPVWATTAMRTPPALRAPGSAFARLSQSARKRIRNPRPSWAGMGRRRSITLRDIVEGICRVADALGLYINEKKTRIVRLSQTYKYLQIKYTLTDTGRVIKRINPKNVTRERRRLKAYKRQLDAGRITYEDVEQSAKSWMGTYAKLMSKDQIRHMKALYKALFGKELIWKSKSHSAAEKPSQPKKTENPLSRSRNRVSRRSLDW